MTGKRSNPRRPARSPLLSGVLCAALCGLFVLAVYLLFGPAGSGSAPGPTPTPAPTATPEPTPSPVPTPVVELPETADMGQEYIDKLVFLGNSITYRMASEYTLPFTQVWVPRLGTVSLGNVLFSDINYYPPEDPENPVEMSVTEAAALRKPEYVVITLGTHDAGWMTEEQFKEIYTSLIDSVLEGSPDTKIICQSIFPVNANVIQEDIDNDSIRTANQWVRDVAAATGSRYLNTYEVLVDETGGMIGDYAPWDGIHLTKDGYDAVFAYIRTHAYQ